MRKLYKRILIGGFALVLLCASPGKVHADFVDGIEMVSQSYSISAQWWGIHEDDSGPYPVSTNYAGGYNVSTSDGTPVTASTAAPFNVLTANASIDRFSFQDYSSCPYHSGGGFLNGSAMIQTQAQGLWDFQTAGNFLNINLNISAFYSYYGTDLGGLTITLTDTTTSSTLLNVLNPVTYEEESCYEQTNYTFAVDPGHVYEFAVSGYSDSFDEDDTSLNISALVTSVPEPASLSLLAVGMFGITLLRRHQR
jgi:hypothetical protein